MSSARPSRARLWSDPDFRMLWLGQTASQFAAQTALVVLPLIAVVTLDAGPTDVGALRAVEQAPVLLLSLAVGAGIDRSRSRTAMVLADLGRALALAAVPAAVLLGLLGLPVLYAVAVAIGTGSAAFDVAYQTALVRLVDREHRVTGTGLLEGSRSAAQIGGPALGGTVAGLLSAPVAVMAAAGFFLASCLSIARIRRSERPAAGPDPHVATRTGDVLRLVLRDGSLRAITLATAAFQFSFAALMACYLLFLTRDAQLSATRIGLVLAASGLGAVGGSLLASVLPRRLGYGATMLAAAVLGDVAMLCVPLGPTAVEVLVLLNVVFGASGQTVNVAMTAVRQAVTPDAVQARVVATITTIGMGAAPVGSLLGGVAAAAAGARTGLLLAAAGLLLSPVAIACSPLAHIGRHLPDAAPSSG